MRIAVLASGGGSNLQALIDHFAGPAADHGRIVWVGSNVADAFALTRAQRAGIACDVIADPSDDSAMLASVGAVGAELVVLAGYLKLVPAAVVRAFHGRMLNVHPSLLPAFGGTGMFGDHVHRAVLASSATVTGATVHFVDDVFDRGAIVAQWPVPVVADDTVRTLAARVLRVEHRLYPLTVAAVAAGTVYLGADGRTQRTRPSVAQTDPGWRFSLMTDAQRSEHRPEDPAALATDVSHLFAS